MIDPHLNLLKSLNENKVDYLLIGGMLAIAYGVPRVTKDIDLFIRSTKENAERLLTTLKKLQFGTAELTNSEEILKNEVTIFKDYLRLDVLTKVKGLEFEEAFQNKDPLKMEDIEVPALSLEDLKASKLAAGRPGDLEDLKHLQEIEQMKKE